MKRGASRAGKEGERKGKGRRGRGDERRGDELGMGEELLGV